MMSNYDAVHFAAGIGVLAAVGAAVLLAVALFGDRRERASDPPPREVEVGDATVELPARVFRNEPDTVTVPAPRRGGAR